MAQHKKKPSRRTNLHLEHKPSDEMDLLISTLNDADLGWTADTCKLQKHHARYGEGRSCDNEVVQLAQTESDGSGYSDGFLANEHKSETKTKAFGANTSEFRKVLA